jgi:hypothetical protein
MRRFALLLVLTACASNMTISEGDRRQAIESLSGQSRFLRVAAYVGIFYGDESRLLVSDAPVNELDLLEKPSGEPIRPPDPVEVLDPGLRVRIRTIEFPTGATIAGRLIMTPRYHPWVYLEVPRHQRPVILVLPQTVSNADDVRAEVDRLLSVDDPTPSFRALPQAQREAIARKSLLEGMGPQALEMAWGYPQKKVIDRPNGTEEWSWSSGARRAFLQTGRLQRWERRQ